ncbi:MAG: hypothetical protein M1838_003937 [Thelocarpon superellum]|nr:MAG: hypothetical protein M1838_003937 [Thelocarpon superellum]
MAPPQMLEREPRSSSPFAPPATKNERSGKGRIRDRLREWQAENPVRGVDLMPGIFDRVKPGIVPNHLTRQELAPPILDEASFSPDEELTSLPNVDNDLPCDLDATRLYFRRGDLVELSTMGLDREPELAIFIRDFANESQFYTARGRWVHLQNKSIPFVVRGFLPPSLLDPILPYLPGAEVPKDLENNMTLFDFSVPRELGGPIINRVLEFWRASEHTYRQHSTMVDNAHQMLAHDTEYRYATLTDIATQILPASTHRPCGDAELYAIHRALAQEDSGFEMDRQFHRLTSLFEIRPKSHLHLVHHVRKWVREYQEALIVCNQTQGGEEVALRVTVPRGNPLPQFLDKARALIAQSRRARAVTHLGALGPWESGTDAEAAAVKPAGNTITSYSSGVLFSGAQTTIIRFFEAWAGHRAFSNAATINAIGPMILRWVGKYDTHNLDHATGFILLQELGVYQPWQNRTALDRRLSLPGHIPPSESSEETRQMNASLLRRPELVDPRWQDTMLHLRKDWGTLPVYCIDNADAEEIDDGISVEPVPGDASSHWIHVHVANPSAFLSPHHELARTAQLLTETVYFPDQVYPMLPKECARHFSLAPDRPALTFSARVDNRGEIRATRITPSIVRHVTSLTPEDLRRVLEPETTMSEQVVTVGTNASAEPRPRAVAADLSRSQIEDLKTLTRLAQQRLCLRAEKGGVFIKRPERQIKVLGPRFPFPRMPSNRRSHFFSGDPVIQLRATPFDPTVLPSLGSEVTVQECMVLACEVAARWCHERAIPIPYRGTVTALDLGRPSGRVQEAAQPPRNHAGFSPLIEGTEYLRSLGRSIVSLTALPHCTMGLDLYTKATSPLRRFGDLLVHWQIEAALRHEAATGRPWSGEQDEEHLALTRPQLEKLMPRFEARTALIARAKRATDRFWATQLLMRAWQFHELPVLPPLECYIHQMGGKSERINGIILAMGLEVQVRSSPHVMAAGVQLGDVHEVTLVEVNCYTRSICVEPVRLLRRADGPAGSGLPRRQL